MKKILSLSIICMAISLSATSQVILLADTAFTTEVGFDSGSASCLYTGGHVMGENMAPGNWVADCFTIPPGEIWTVDSVTVFGFQFSGLSPSVMANYPFQEGYLQIYAGGQPGNGGYVIWGDSATDVLASTGITDIYRVDTSPGPYTGITGCYATIRYLTLFLSPAPNLAPGTYWLSWAGLPYTSPGAGPGYPIPWCPPKVLPGRINPPNQQGRYDSSGTWKVAIDNSDTLGFNKIIKGSYTGGTAVGNVNERPYSLLSQNVPNPFSGTTGISFYMPQTGHAKLTVLNAVGQVVANLFDGNADVGANEVTFYAENLSAGVYYYQLTTCNSVENKKMMLLK